MASTINASNSGFGGIVSTGDSSGQLQLQTAATTAVTLDTSQNATFAGKVTSAGALTLASNGTTTAVTIDTSQNVGIGTTSPTDSDSFGKAVDAVGTNGAAYYTRYSGNTANFGFYGTSINGTYLGQGGALPVIFYTTNTERMRIDSSGNTILGSNTSTTAYNKLNLWSPASTLNGIFMEKQSQVVVQMGFKANTNTDFFIGTGSYTLGTYGVYLANTGTSWISVSDERQKDIIEPIENALTKVSAIRTVIGKYKHDEEGVRRSFLIAQDVQAVFPEAVKTQNDEEALLGLSYTDVIPLLVAAIKEQQTIINDLKARIETLEAK